MPQSSYFDCHFHPVFKQFLTKYEEADESTRTVDELRKAMDLKDDLLEFLDENVLHILESQCCYDQIEKGGVRLGIASIAAIEHGIADSEGFMAKILRSSMTRPLDHTLLKKVRNGETTYNKLFRKELKLYEILSANSTHEPLVRFLTRKSPQEIEEKGFCLALGMEGGHNISTHNIAKPYTAPVIRDSTDSISTASLKNLQQYLWDHNMDLFYITLTHLSHVPEQPLATHAFGMKLLQHAAFFPVGDGLTQLGKEIIDTAYDMTVNTGHDTKSTPILIDIKHMSLKSRQDFYAHRKTREEKNQTENLPIIASHAGVTGYSVSEWTDALKQYSLFSKGSVKCIEIITERKKAGEWGSELNEEFTFNPWTINLMDEDILEILRSRGLIGMSLDVRILGFQAKLGLSAKEQSEYLSIPSFRHHFPHLSGIAPTSEPLEGREAMESWMFPTKEERHPLCLCFNIIHIVSTGMIHKRETMDADPWKHICIGSDYDGLIEPLKICRDATGMQSLERNLLKWLPVAEKAYRKENGGPVLLSYTNDEPDYADLQQKVRNIMFENGKRFLEKWLKNDL